MNALATELYSISKDLQTGGLNVSEVGNILPASLMVHELDGLMPTGCVYMNNWGCERLGTSVDEVNELASAYYDKYFVKEEIQRIIVGIQQYLAAGDFDQQYNFFQRVKLHQQNDFSWFYTVCKLIKIKVNHELENKLILLSSPVVGMDNLISIVNKSLDQNAYVRTNYPQFSSLTCREKEIIGLLANGDSSKEIAEKLFLSNHTIATHRKNIIKKLNCRSFAEIVRFAVAFDLI